MSRRGFEPPTQGFSVPCSNLLSYPNWSFTPPPFLQKKRKLWTPFGFSLSSLPCESGSCFLFFLQSQKKTVGVFDKVKNKDFLFLLLVFLLLFYIKKQLVFLVFFTVVFSISF